MAATRLTSLFDLYKEGDEEALPEFTEADKELWARIGRYQVLIFSEAS